MRKWMAALLALSLVCAGALLGVARQVDALSDQVRFTQRLYHGDVAAAEGLVLELDSYMDGHLFWDTVLPLGGEARTEFRFSQSEIHGPYIRREYGLGADFPSGFGWSSSRGTDYENYDIRVEDPGDSTEILLLPLLQAVSRRTPTGGTHEEVLRVADYFDTLPIRFSLDVNELFTEVEQDGYHNVYSVAHDSLWEWNNSLRDYFAIPVPEKMQLRIRMSKNPQGLVTELDVTEVYEQGVWGAPGFETHSQVTESGCYFTFSPFCREMESGERFPLDMSAVPGGRGVYLLPFEYRVPVDSTDGKELRFVNESGFRCIYPFTDEDAQPEDLQLREDLDRLFLTTREGDGLWLTVVELSSGTALQRLKLMEGEEVSLQRVWAEEDFLLYLSYSGEFCLCVERDGVYERRMNHSFARHKESEAANHSDQIAVAFDGERLAWAYTVYRKEPYYDTASSVGVAVYSSEGLVYDAVQVNSLDTGSAEYGQRVTAFGAPALRLRWE